MTSRVVTTEADRGLLLRFIGQHPLPFTVQITKGKRRSVEQNKLNRLWMNEIAEQIGDTTPEKVRGQCKLMFGIPILREENEDFRERYDSVIKPHSYDDKLIMMMEPLDFPVTRLMTTSQETRYLDAIYAHFTQMGLKLTEPTQT